METITRFLDEEAGVTMVEYGLIMALIAIAIISLLARIGASISSIFQVIASTFGVAS